MKTDTCLTGAAGVVVADGADIPNGAQAQGGAPHASVVCHGIKAIADGEGGCKLTLPGGIEPKGIASTINGQPVTFDDQGVTFTSFGPGKYELRLQVSTSDGFAMCGTSLVLN